MVSKTLNVNLYKLVFSTQFYALLFSFIVLTSQSCKKEIPVESQQQPVIAYRPFGLSVFWDACKTPTGETLILGHDGSSPQLLKISDAGQLIWRKFIPSLTLEPQFSHAVVTKSDGSILVLGSQPIRKFIDKLLILKMNTNGEVLKITNHEIKLNDSLFSNPQYSTTYGGFYAPDNKGGFYLQISLTTRLSYQVGWDYYVMHYNNNDSIDQSIDFFSLTQSNFYELAPGDHGSINLLSFVTGPNRFAITQVNPDEYLQGKIVKNFDAYIDQRGLAMVSKSDKTHMYSYQLITETNSNYTEGLYVTKTDLISGALEKDWILPLRVNVVGSWYPSLIQPEFDNDNVYFAVTINRDSYILKSSKEGQFQWLYKLGGNLSNDMVLKLLPQNNQLSVIGYGTFNRSRENTMFILKLDQNGKIISK